MTTALAFDIGLVMLVLGMGMWMLMVREAVVAVIVFVIYGLLMAIAWVRLSAVDVALTEAAIGSGITGMLLLNAAARLRTGEARWPRPPLALGLAAALLCAMISAGLAAIVLSPADPAPSLAPIALEHLDQTGLGNPVAGVLFAYRALDTLLEKVVVLLALIGVWSLAPDRLWGGSPALDSYMPVNDILVFFARVLPPFGIVFAIYMTWTGASNPGGAFQGGTVLAVMWLLVMMAGVARTPSIGNVRLRWLLIAGPALFLAIGVAGFFVAAGFLAYPPGYAKALIVVVEIALAVSIGATLALLAAGPPERMQKP
jgi:multisubunit Na+/H+ antiporter MnhB subunit